MVLSDSTNSGPETIKYLKSDIYSENDIVDFDEEYIDTVIGNFDKQQDIYISEISKLVNEYATGFGREDMDTIKQSAFMLAYLESQLLDTPKIVIVNEIVEITKLFGDPQTAKMVNGIIHKIISDK